jgi:TRAP-type C4-dicarboxylate transport system permease small subunit
LAHQRRRLLCLNRRDGTVLHHTVSAAPSFQEPVTMNPVRIVAIILIVAGFLGLLYGGFSYTKDTTVMKLGPLEISAKEKQNVNVPMWVGVGAIVVGGLLLVLGGKKG